MAFIAVRYLLRMALQCEEVLTVPSLDLERGRDNFLRKKKPRQPAPISFLDFFLTFVMTYTRLCRAYQSDCSALPESY